MWETPTASDKKGWGTKVGKTVLGYGEATIRDSQNCIDRWLFVHPDFAWCMYEMEQPVTIPD